MINFPENVKRIISVFEKNSYKAYAVGGCVRDSVMGKAPADWDITCSCTPDKTLEIFEKEGIKTIPTGLKHGTVSVLLDGEIFECTTHRVDGSYTDSRRPDFVEFTPRLKDDLSRRDFTVNAMAASPEGGLCDCFFGLDDIKNKLIRCVGDPEVRFGEDALRILRALRFATVLDFEIEENTFVAVQRLGHLLENISAERKTVELAKILCSEHADRGISLLFESGIIRYLLPDAQKFTHKITHIDNIFSLRLSAFMWHSGCRDLSRLRLSNEDKKAISLLLSPVTFDATDEGARRALAKYGELAICSCKIQHKPDLEEKISKQIPLCPAVSIKQLGVNGSDLLSLGIEPQKIGKILDKLLDAVLTSPELNQRELLISIAKTF